MRKTPMTDAAMEAMPRNHTGGWPKVVPVDMAKDLEAEVLAWRERFPAYVYRPQDDCVSLRLEKVKDWREGASEPTSFRCSRAGPNDEKK